MDIVDYSSMAYFLGIDNSAPEFQEFWQESQACLTSYEVFFLEERFIKEMNEYLQLPKDAYESFLEAFQKIKNNKNLKRLAWHCHYILFHVPEHKSVEVSLWPDLAACMGALSPMFYAVICVSGIPKTLGLYKNRNIPKKIAQDTFEDIKDKMQLYFNRTGCWGLMSRAWFYSNHLKGKLFRLGRLQFGISDFKGKINVYKNNHTGKVTVLSAPGIKYRSDGQWDGTCNISDHEKAWVSVFNEYNGMIIGNPILSNGYASSETAALSQADWKLVLSPGDNILDVHIPGGSKMDHEACGQSFKEAADFFAEYFPELNFSAYHCETWLLDPQLQQLLPASSNIVKFQREFYLYPVLSFESRIYHELFGAKAEDLSNAPQNTSIQRAVINHVSAGKSFWEQAGFILKDDLDWGKCIYLNNK